MLALLTIGSMNLETASAWGPEGHLQIGELALRLADEQAASRIWLLLGTNDIDAVNKACNWPDEIEETPQWEWAAAQHFVNIPRAAQWYERERDCPDGLCVTEAIKKYAGQLTDSRLGRERRWQAFAWLCHLVGDLHQPLHAGYPDDRGGNYVQISYKGEQDNLHQFWDRILIRERLPSGSWQKHRPDGTMRVAEMVWNPYETDNWTSESHALVRQASYPPGEVIQSDFADRSWLLIQNQWRKAARRLAQILNATIGEGQLIIDRSGAAVNGEEE